MNVVLELSFHVEADRNQAPESHIWVRVVAFSSNFLAGGQGGYSTTANRTGLMPVDLVVGIVEPTFGRYHTA